MSPLIACVVVSACKSSEPEPAPEPTKDVDVTALATEHAVVALDEGTVSETTCLSTKIDALAPL